MNRSTAGPVRLLRAAIAVVLLFAIGGTIWLVGTAAGNPDVRAKTPGWFEGLLSAPFWLPLTVTFLGGCLLVVWIYARAIRRLDNGEDLHDLSFRDRTRRALRQRLEEDRAQGGG